MNHDNSEKRLITMRVIHCGLFNLAKHHKNRKGKTCCYLRKSYLESSNFNSSAHSYWKKF